MDKGDKIVVSLIATVIILLFVGISLSEKWQHERKMALIHNGPTCEQVFMLLK